MPTEEHIWLEVTCYALRQDHGGWDIECGPLPFSEILAMHRANNPAAAVVEITSRRVRRDISAEEDKTMRQEFIACAKEHGWSFDALNVCWNAPDGMQRRG